MDAHTWDERYSGSDLVWPATPNRWVTAALEDAVPGRALDLACGEGRNAIWLAEQGWTVTGLDFSGKALERARAREAQELGGMGDVTPIEWIQADLVGRELRFEAYDLVLVTYLHLEDWERREALRAAVQALSPGGTLLVVGHDRTNLTEGTGGPQDPAVLFAATDVEEDLQDHLASGNLRLERSGRVAREVETEDGPRVAWDALVHARRLSRDEQFSLG